MKSNGHPDHQAKAIKKLIESDIANTARIAALERLVGDIAIEALGDSPDTASILKRITPYFHQKLKEIKDRS